MAREEITTTLTDADGNAHAYELTQHRASEGFNLLARLTRIVGEGGGELAGALDIGALVKGGAKGGDVKSLLAADTSALDLTRVGSALSILAQRILTEGGADLCKEILKHARRQTAGPDGNLVWQRVGEQFDFIYADNYGELFGALLWAIKANFRSLGTLRPFALGSVPGR